MTEIYTIADGIRSFIDEFDFNEKSNTEKAYLRALTLFSEFIQSDPATKSPEYRDLHLTSPLSDLPKYIGSGFSSWLRDQEYPTEYRGRHPVISRSSSTLSPAPEKTRKYSIATINLYESAFTRVLDFWRDRERISFSVQSQRTSERASSTRKTRKSRRDVGLTAKAVPRDLGELLMKASRDWVSGLDENANRLEVLRRFRARALIAVIANSGLRVSDIVQLTKTWRNTKINEHGNAEVVTVKSGTTAQCHFSKTTLKYLDEYLTLRFDTSPWLFIQHGKSVKKKISNQADYERIKSSTGKTQRGYGAPVSPLTVWREVQAVAALAGYDRKNSSDYVSTHALRHWLAQYMRDNDVPLTQIQEALGHSSLEITRAIYAPESNQNMARTCVDTLDNDK